MIVKTHSLNNPQKWLKHAGDSDAFHEKSDVTFHKLKCDLFLLLSWKPFQSTFWLSNHIGKIIVDRLIIEPFADPEKNKF